MILAQFVIKEITEGQHGKAKTQPTGESVESFLNTVGDEGRHRDAFTILELIRKATRSEPTIWGSTVVGFGDTHLKYASGRALDPAYSPLSVVIPLT
jgi:hypothetical protein